jgi:DNA-binding transcriptional ArsR family regulator
MGSKRPHKIVIEKPGQFRAMNSAVRQQVLSTMRLLEPCSVGEIAARLGRQPETLYYHVDILLDAGLVRAAGSRPAGRRDEALYEVACDRLQYHPTRRTPTFLRELRRGYSTTLRTTERRLLEAVGVDGEVRDGPGKNMRVQAYAARLSADELTELNSRLDAVRQFLLERAGADEGEPHQVLLVMSPVLESP